MNNFFLFLLIIKISFHFSQIILPFEKKNQNMDIKDNLFNNEVINQMKIGTPKQIIQTNLDFSQSSFYISNDQGNRKFISEQSKTFKDSNKVVDTKYLPFNKGTYSIDTCYFILKDIEISIENFPFFSAYVQKENKTFYSSSIGLSMMINEENFITYLKNKKIINNEIFTINYFEHFVTSQIGEIIIGDYPHIYNKDLKKESIIYLKTKKFNFPSKWNIKFDEINYEKNTIEKSIDVFFDINILGIIGTISIEKELNSTFFEDKINKKLCQVSFYKNEKRFYFCNKDVDIKNFKNITFYHKSTDYTFTLTYKDLFVKIEDKYYFLIVYDNYDNSKLTLGEVFLKKYKMSFNLRENSIFFYDIYSHEKRTSSFWKTINIILIIILIVLSIYVVIRITLRIISRRMKSKYLQEINEFIINLEQQPTKDNKITL